MLFLMKMTISPKIYPFFVKAHYHLKFFSLSFLGVIVEGMEFWTWFGIKPFLFLTLLYINAIYSLPFLNIWSLIVLGVLQDGYYDYPLGYSSSQLLLLYLVLMRQKKNQMLPTFIMSWIYFSLFIVMTCILKVCSQKYLGCLSFPFKKLLGDILLTISLFPLIARGIFWLNHKFSLSLVKEAG